MSTTPDVARQLVQDLTILCGEPNILVADRMQYTLEAHGFAMDDTPAVAAGAVVLLSMLAGSVDELHEAKVIDSMTAAAMSSLVREFTAAVCRVASPEVARG